MKIETEIIGDKEIQKKLELLMKKAPELAEKAIIQSCFHVESEAKKLVPVDTGRLRSSITNEVQVSKKEIVGKVGTDVYYAPYVEFGIINRGNFKVSKTGKLLAPVGNLWSRRHGFGDTNFLYISGRPKPFLLPALKNSRSKILKFIKNAIKSLEKI